MKVSFLAVALSVALVGCGKPPADADKTNAAQGAARAGSIAAEPAKTTEATPPPPAAEPNPLEPPPTAASPYAARLPQLNLSCGPDIPVHSDAGGPVFINGKEASLKVFNDNYFEATDAAAGVTISISINPDGTASGSYTGKHRANGICSPTH